MSVYAWSPSYHHHETVSWFLKVRTHTLLVQHRHSPWSWKMRGTYRECLLSTQWSRNRYLNNLILAQSTVSANRAVSVDVCKFGLRTQRIPSSKRHSNERLFFFRFGLKRWKVKAASCYGSGLTIVLGAKVVYRKRWCWHWCWITVLSNRCQSGSNISSISVVKRFKAIH